MASSSRLTRHSHEGPQLGGQFDHIVDESAHSTRVDLPVELIMKHLHFGRTREGGCQQVALLSVSPEQIHDLVILLRHAKEVMAHIPGQCR